MSVAASAAAEAGVGDEGERPTLSPDPKAARQAMEDAEFARDRLKTLLSRLETRCNETAKAEALATWEGEAEEMEARRIAKMTEFADFYPAMEKRIVDHLYSMRALDREIDDLNRRRPNWSVAGIAYNTPAFTMDLKIPNPYKKGQLLWPPPQPNLALQYLALMPPDPFIASKAMDYVEERHRRMLEGNRRAIAEAEQRQREREEREQAESKAAAEADRAAWHAKHGWPT